MKKIDSFINLYSMMKTTRFKLIPVGKTEENFRINSMLSEDEHRAESYSYVKNYLDRYYKAYIDKILPTVRLSGLNEYAELYYKANKNDADNKAMQKSEEDLRKQIADALTGDKKRYDNLFSKEVIQALPDFLTEEEEKDRAKEFTDFVTYFSGFFENRKNIFTAEEKSTGIAYRCINDNLPRFLDNVKSFIKIKEAIPGEIESINAEFKDLFSVRAEDLFCVDGFTYALCQDDIDKYNQVIGGYSNSDKTKIQGLNEKINLYNQQLKDKSQKLPQLKPLYKQILSKRNTVSFIPEKFKDDNAVLKAINSYFTEWMICDSVMKIKELFCSLADYDLNGIYVKNDLALTEISKGTFGTWDAVRRAWEKEYDDLKGYKDTESYLEARAKANKAIKSFSISEIDRLGSTSTEVSEKKSVSEWAAQTITELADAVLDNYNKKQAFISAEYTDEKKLCANGDRIGEIKNLLDSVKAFEGFVKLFLGTGKEENKDDVFYGETLPRYDAVAEIDGLYDKVRNYVTQKPYSTDKIKLNFRNPQFLGGWDRNKEADYSAVLLRKDGLYYLAIMDSKSRGVFKSTPEIADQEPCFEKIVYKQIPNAAKYFSSKQILPQNPPDSIKRILEKKKADNKSLTKCEIEEFIDYIKYDFLENYSFLRDENGEKYFDFSLKPAEEYQTLQEFFADLDGQSYNIRYHNVSENYINELINCGKLYLFQIYNKDFSQYSHGNQNLHTLYFKALFDEQNLKNVTFKLNGDAEMFYRKASIKYSDEVMEKGHHYNELKDKFNYPIIKDRRYTHDQFMLHVPITLNFNSEGVERINNKVRAALKECTDNYVIGIDRGERNLLYICVIDGKGNIVKQFSLNDIVNEYNGQEHHTDYHALLDAKEKERLDARKNWTAVENIRELKEGYISQVIHKICELVEKYDAVIAMEDLNFGFKSSRSKVEKSVYQKFEKMLIDKLNFCVNKKTDSSLPGGLYNAYQLTEKFESFKKMGKQNGFIFYIPAWLTSKIDPTTGFADMLYPKYESAESSKKFFEKFKRIAYNPDKDYFEFEFDYSDFGSANTDYRKRWTLCTYGNRIETFRNSEKNNEWDSKSIKLTEEFKKLFEEHSIALTGDMKSEILARSDAGFFRGLTRLLKLTLQMRNSTTGTSEDYLISPVMNKNGEFYCSNDYTGEDAPLPIDADANGAFHIAKKALWAIEQIKSADDVKTAKLSISKAEWLEYVQKQ